MRIALKIVSSLFILISAWVIIFVLPKVIMLSKYFDAKLPIITYLYPLGFLSLGIAGWVVIIKKWSRSKLTYILVLQGIYVILLFILGRTII
jgi:hypothetical protein